MSRRNSSVNAAPVFAALGDETRLALVARLGHDGPLSIARLTEETRVTRQAVTKHLEVLARAGLVLAQRTGRERLWVVNPQKLHDARRYLEQMSKQWDEALERLAAFVER
ncbi:MAG TPA: metalloregulator ArsR/SmtB family transcription factor [Polyangiaceae bacterium]|nr:metalloregulator ArsR/SmtB family transcription factor [Polyangiaceae bacterium]